MATNKQAAAYASEIMSLRAEVERLRAAWVTLFPLLDPMDMDEHQHGAWEFLRGEGEK